MAATSYKGSKMQKKRSEPRLRRILCAREVRKRLLGNYAVRIQERGRSIQIKVIVDLNYSRVPSYFALAPA